MFSVLSGSRAPSEEYSFNDPTTNQRPAPAEVTGSEGDMADSKGAPGPESESFVRTKIPTTQM